MDVINICREVGLKYDLDDAEILEAGSFPTNQMDILMGLSDIWMREPTETNMNTYLEAKAQFILANSKKTKPILYGFP